MSPLTMWATDPLCLRAAPSRPYDLPSFCCITLLDLMRAQRFFSMLGGVCQSTEIATPDEKQLPLKFEQMVYYHTVLAVH